MTSDFHNRHKVFSRLGSFWHQNTADGFDRSFARALSRVPDLCAAPSRMSAAVDWLSGHNTTRSGHGTRRFRSTDVKVIGPDLQKRLLEKHGLGSGTRFVVMRPLEDKAGVEGHGSLQTEPGDDFERMVDDDGSILLFPMPDGEFDIQVDPAVLRPVFLLPWPHGHRPVSLFSTNRDLTCGIDYTCADGLLVFRENPAAIFNDGLVHYRDAEEERRPFMAYTLQGDFRSAGRRVSAYMRDRTSVKSLELAAAEFAGLVVPEVGGTVGRTRVNIDGSASYELDDGVLDVGYPHQLLSHDMQVAPDEVVGGVFSIMGPTTARHQSWYRRLHWNEGLLLDGVSPVSGITIPDQPCLVEAYDETDGLIHVRMHLQGDGDKLSRFWHRIKRAELAGHTPLNAYFEFSAAGETTTVNALDFYFEHLLGRRALIVQIDEGRIGGERASRLREFIHREKPVGCVIIYYTGAGPAYVDSTVTYLTTGGGVFLTSGEAYLTI
jgi:hypothetical protein